MARPASELDVAVTKAVELFKDHFSGGDCNRMSKVYKAGAISELIRCYLQRMQIAEAVNHLKDKGVETSKTAVSRYWIKFRQSGIERLRVK